MSNHYLNQCWLIVKCTLRNKLQQNSNRYTIFSIHENAFENVVTRNLKFEFSVHICKINATYLNLKYGTFNELELFKLFFYIMKYWVWTTFWVMNSGFVTKSNSKLIHMILRFDLWYCIKTLSYFLFLALTVNQLMTFCKQNIQMCFL